MFSSPVGVFLFVRCNDNNDNRWTADSFRPLSGSFFLFIWLHFSDKFDRVSVFVPCRGLSFCSDEGLTYSRWKPKFSSPVGVFLFVQCKILHWCVQYCFRPLSGSFFLFVGNRDDTNMWMYAFSSPVGVFLFVPM